MTSTEAVSAARIPRRQIFAWASWDWGMSAFNALITTFVFSVYLTSSYFIDPKIVAAYKAAGGATGASSAAKSAYDSASAALSSGLGWALAIGGIVVALIAPIVGQRTDAGGKRKLWLGINTVIVVVVTALMFFVQATPSFFLLGIVLLTVGTIFYEMAGVTYNAMLLQVSTRKTIGRVSGFGWGAGYLGGIVVLVISLVGFILGDPPYWFGISDDAGMNIRVIAIFAAVWALVFAIPVLVAVPENTAVDPDAKLGIVASYRKLFRRIKDLYVNERPTFYFLAASAVFRDGLAAVFTFGGVLAGVVFGFTATQVIFFAIAANIVAGIGVFVAGVFDDKFGPKPVIVTSLIGLVVTGLALFFLHDSGQTAFWVGGLILTLFVGPAQSSSRTFLGRLAPAGSEGEIFGLYATTGRAISFLAPALFALFVGVGGAAYWGILGIVIVLLAGLLLLIPLRNRR